MKIKNEHMEIINEIKSGALDADETEVQRLRAALVEIKQLLNEDQGKIYGEFKSWNHMQAWKVATQALSTTTEPTGQNDEDGLLCYRIDERCPECGSVLIANEIGDKWCSMIGCDYEINA